ncbi:MAG: ABC transporter permease [Bacteroidales bacterium]|nr:ABC transporter permease [Bacteroidales bacterium]
MRTLLFLIQKEFIQVFRDKTLLPLIFVMPLIQLLILVYAADLNMKNIEYAVFDEDNSSFSRELQDKYLNSPFFLHEGQLSNQSEVDNELRSAGVDMVIHIPAGFEKSLLRSESVDVQFLIDGINSASAVIIANYAQNILFDFNRSVIKKYHPENVSKIQQIGVSYRHWYNPELESKIFMVPGILVLLVSMIGWILTALNIVKEKELGTIEQINVTPIRRFQFILGKLLPFWFIALFELAFGLALGRLLFDVPIVGSLGILFAFTAVYMVVPLGFGLMISAVSRTQQQVMFLAFFFNLTFILMSGLFTPSESMPDWAIYANYLNPLSYFMRVIRMILLKGSGFMDILPDFIGVSIYGLIVLILATLAYRKRV